MRLPVLEYKRLHDITGPESGEILYDDGGIKLRKEKRIWNVSDG